MNYAVEREKERMGFVRALKRDCCVNCLNCFQTTRKGTVDLYNLRCTWGRFGVSASSICDRFLRRPANPTQAAAAAASAKEQPQ